MPKNKSLSQQRTPAKRISAEELFKPKPGSSSSPFSIRFASQEPTAERIKLKPRERKTQTTETGLKILTPNKLLTRLPIF